MPNQKKFLDQDGLTYLISKMNNYPTNDILGAVIDAIDEVKQDKETGKGLSTNDFTDAYKNLLDNLPDPGDENIIETIKVNNSALTPVGKAVNIDLSSYATNSALNDKVDKVTGKGLSTNDYTAEEKEKLAGIAAGAQVNTVTGVKGSAENAYRTGNISITKANIGLGNVDNTTDLNKPISTATQAALDEKVDVVDGKGLSTNDYTTTEKNKLAGIEAGAQKNVTYSASNGVTLTGTNFTNSGVRSISTGTANGTISVNTNGTATNIAVAGLGSLAYKSSLSASDVGALATSLKGANNGVAELDANGKVPSSQLPSYVDDVLEYNGKSNFPSTGESGKIYVDTATNLTYRWGGTAYAEISPSLALGETSTTAYRGDRGKTAYDHSQSAHARTDATAVTASSTNGNIKINGTETTVYTHPGSGTNPHGTTKSDIGLGNVGNFKAVSTVASQGLTDTEKSNARTNIGAGTSNLTIGTSATTAAAGNHTHNISLASGGTATVNLAANTAYTLTAGGKSVIFKTPADTDTTALGSMTGTLGIDHGGTGKTTAAEAWTALGGGASGKHADSYFALAPITRTATFSLVAGTITYNISASGVTATSTNIVAPGEGITEAQLKALQKALIVTNGQAANTVKIKCLGTVSSVADIPLTITIIK